MAINAGSAVPATRDVWSQLAAWGRGAGGSDTGLVTRTAGFTPPAGGWSRFGRASGLDRSTRSIPFRRVEDEPRPEGTRTGAGCRASSRWLDNQQSGQRVMGGDLPGVGTPITDVLNGSMLRLHSDASRPAAWFLAGRARRSECAGASDRLFHSILRRGSSKTLARLGSFRPTLDAVSGGRVCDPAKPLEVQAAPFGHVTERAAVLVVPIQPAPADVMTHHHHQLAVGLILPDQGARLAAVLPQDPQAVLDGRHGRGGRREPNGHAADRTREDWAESAGLASARTLEAQSKSGPGAPVTGNSTLHWSPHSRQRIRSCITPIRWVTNEMPKGIPAEALHRRHKRSEAVGCAAIRFTSRWLVLPISGQPSRHEPTVDVRQVASDRRRKASNFTSTSHLCWQSGHRTVRRMRSGRLASVLARNGAPGLRPQAGQEGAFAESDGLGESMWRTLTPKAELGKVALHSIEGRP
jgi:hypothetical protein